MMIVMMIGFLLIKGIPHKDNDVSMRNITPQELLSLVKKGLLLGDSATV
jgi:hypothetical protein